MHARRVYLDVSYSASTSTNSGVQRTARRLAREAVRLTAAGELDAVPVLWSRGQFQTASQQLVQQGFRQTPFEERPLGRLLTRMVRQEVVSRTATRLRKLLWSKRTKAMVSRFLPSKPVVPFQPGDVLFLADNWWGGEMFERIAELRSQGVTVGTMVYDLIPLRYPQFCGEPFVQLFGRWLERSLDEVDFFVGISQTTCDDLLAYADELGRPIDPSRVDYCHLGADFGPASPDLGSAQTPNPPQVRPAVQQFFADNSPFLMVSTIEPRKNHHYLLDAFELVWQRHPQAKLAVVGRVGWMCDDILGRLRQHPQAGRQLGLFHDLSDDELAYCYQQSRAFVFSSTVEGFGLPIVESLHHGLPVYASDIAIHREVGGSWCRYFDLSNPSSLATLVGHSLDAGEPPVAPGFQPVAWEDCCRQLLGICQRMADTPTTAPHWAAPAAA